MKILFISTCPVNNAFNSGNTYFNLFGAFPDEYTFHNLSLRPGRVEPGFISSALQITDGDVVKSVLKRKEIRPARFMNETEKSAVFVEERSDGKVGRLYRYKEAPVVRYLGFAVRDFFWSWGTWKKSVKEYIDELKPDLIFFAPSGMTYHHRVFQYVAKISGAKIALFHLDDHYALNYFSLDPLFWWNRLTMRRRVQEAVEIADEQFGISESLCAEYSRSFKKTCRLLTKGRDFSGTRPQAKAPSNDNLSLVYTGNILVGRWRVLAYIGKLLDRLASEGLKATLQIYSGNAPTKKIQKAFDSAKCIRFMGAVPNSEIQAIQENADALVHVETFRFIEKFAVRYSFSTKIVDYLHSGRCVLAAGANDVSPIKIFLDNEMGVALSGRAARDQEELKKVFDPAIRESRAQSAWDYGRKNCDIATIRRRLMETLQSLVEKKDGRKND